MSLLLALVLSATAVSPNGAVATAHPLASAAAAEVLRTGGNAADAAVAAAFALSVVEPQSSGIGGGGFALVWLAKERRVVALDFREVAPAGATPTMFRRQPVKGARPSLDGGLAVAVPGAVRGYAELARRFGKLGAKGLPRLVEPAARIAEQGFPVDATYVARTKDRFQCLAARPAAAQELLARDAAGRPAVPEPGWRLVRKDLARTLREIGRTGGEAFHRGKLAERIAAAARADGGVLTAADLAAYRVRERAPVEGRYRGRRVVSMGLPSAGGAILIALLQALEHEDPRAGGHRPVRFLHAMAELEKRLYARRAALGDPDFVPGAAATAEELVSEAYAERLAAAIGPRAADAPSPAAVREGSHTTHLSVIDAEGNAVAMTTTVNYFFGSCVVVPGTGILLNDEMDDFDAAAGVPNEYGLVGTGANAPAPGKVPLSSMAPTLVFDPAGKLLLAVGSPGGSRIPTTVAQAISHLVDDGMSLEQALAAPRIHHQWRPEALQVEPNGLEAETARALEALGHRLRWEERRWGNAQAVRVTPEGWREAACDPRGEGVPAAP
jgi:gamma-glutamyltranspeptidase / glutathione hydrolase